MFRPALKDPHLLLGHEPSYLIAGEIGVRHAPASLITVLGSCVAVCLWSAQLRIGGMNHYLLPLATHADNSFLGGNLAISALVEAMEEAGCERRQLIAKVFGGAHSGKHAWNGGAENILMAWSELRKARIGITAADVGGRAGRRICFDVANGHVYVSKLPLPASEGGSHG